MSTAVERLEDDVSALLRVQPVGLFHRGVVSARIVGLLLDSPDLLLAYTERHPEHLASAVASGVVE